MRNRLEMLEKQRNKTKAKAIEQLEYTRICKGACKYNKSICIKVYKNNTHINIYKHTSITYAHTFVHKYM